MRIVYLEVNPGGGGAEEYALNLANAAVAAGHEVCFVLGSDKGELVDRVRDGNFDLIVVPMRSSFNPFAVCKSIFALKRFIGEYHPDIIHTQMLREQSLAIGVKILGTKTKLVRTFHRLDQFDWKMEPLMPLYRKYTDAYIAISDYVREYLSNHGIREDVYMVHNGVAEVTTQTKEKGLGFLGRISPEKGIKEFISQNIDILAKTSLVIGGDGPDAETIKSIAKRENLMVSLEGKVSEKTDFFEKFNVLVLPSSTEALPLVVLEAFSAATPVVAFDLPSLRPLISSKNGVLVKPGDYVGLAEAALSLSESREYKKYSENAHETYLGDYTLTEMWQQTSEIYDKIRADD